MARNFFAELGSKGVDEDALLLWLKDTTTGDKINEMMLNVRNGGSITEPTERSTVGSSDQTFCYSSKCI